VIIPVIRGTPSAAVSGADGELLLTNSSVASKVKVKVKRCSFCLGFRHVRITGSAGQFGILREE